MTDPPQQRELPSHDSRNRTILVTATTLIALTLIALMILFPHGNDAGKRYDFTTAGRPSVGTGPVQVVVFSDYQCPVCKLFNEQHLPALIERYARTGRATITELASPILGEGSDVAAAAAECVYRQNPDAYWTYTDQLFAAQKREHTWVTTQLLIDLAPPTINRTALRTCLTDPSTRTAVTADRKQHERAGLRGTPTVFVNGQRARDYGSKTIAELIEAQVAASGTPDPTQATSHAR